MIALTWILSDFVDRLDVAAEDRLLTEAIYPGNMLTDDGHRCLVGVARDLQPGWRGMHIPEWSVAFAFDQFVSECRGVAGVMEAIRARILDNRARRELAPAPRENAVENRPVHTVSR